MSDLQKALETTEATIETLQSYAENIRSRMTEKQPVAGVKFKQWSPVGGGWYVHNSGEVVKSDSSVKFKEFGTERPTEQQAERAAVEMRKFNRLLSLRDELCGDEVAEKGATDLKYVVYFDARANRWSETNYTVNLVTPCFTTKFHAKRACDMLNSGEVVL